MAPISKRPRQSDDFDAAPTTNGGAYYDNVPGTSMTRPSGSTFSTHPSAAAYPAATTSGAATNGVNGNATYLSSGVEDDEEMAPPKSTSTAAGARGSATRARGRGSRGGRGSRARGRGRGASTAAATRAEAGYMQEEADDAPPNPLTFQCRSCFRLLGDSFAFVATDPDLGYVILSEVTELVLQDGSYETSTEPGKDIGSTFARLRCAGCNSTIGRNYRTTPRDLDDLRDCFSLEVDAVYTYQLGSNYTRQLEQEEPSDAAQKDRSSIPTTGTATAGGAVEGTQELLTKMEKTRALTIELSDRLIKAEAEIRRYSTLIDGLVSNPSQERQPSPLADVPATPPLNGTEPTAPAPAPPAAAAAEKEGDEAERQPTPNAEAKPDSSQSSAKAKGDASQTSATRSTRTTRRS